MATPHPTKTCTKCGESKPIAEFPYRKDEQRYVAQCKTCVHERQAAWLRDARARKSATRDAIPPNINDIIRDQRDELLARIQANVTVDPETGCHEWLSAKRRGGYGMLFVRAGDRWFQFGAHRIIACLCHGLDLTKDDALACHQCDNRCCCNERHIYSGSPKENQQDKFLRSRMPAGMKWKLTPTDVLNIKHALRRGDSRRHIASRFGISKESINGIATGRTWAYVQ